MIKAGRWYMGYGIFLFLCGLAGYLSNPEAAKTALISGSVFGGLMCVFGFLMHRCIRPSWWAALLTTILLIGVFTWRSAVTWQKVFTGGPKVFAATLITLMLLGTIMSFMVLLRNRRVALESSSTVSAS